MIDVLPIFANVHIPVEEHAALGGVMTYLSWIIQSVGGCIAAIGGMLLYRNRNNFPQPLRTRDDPPPATTEDLKRLEASSERRIEKLDEKLDGLRDDLVRRDEATRTELVQRDTRFHDRLNFLTDAIGVLRGELASRAHGPTRKPS